MTDQAEVKATIEEEALAAADRVLHDPPSAEVMFMGVKLELRPLPISYSKQLAAVIVPARAKMGKLVSDLTTRMSDVKNPKLKDKAKAKAAKDILSNAEKNMDESAGIDIMVAEGLLDAACILAKFYEITTTKEKINDEATLSEVSALVNKQLEVNGQEDFLLRPFKAFMSAFLGTGDVETRSQDLLSMLAFANVGK